MTSPFESLTIRGVTARNRLWASPMCTYSVIDESGEPTSWHLVHYGSLALGGSGIVFCEATAVEPNGRISARDTGLWTDAQAEAWKTVAKFITDHGAIAAIQLAHAGREASMWPQWGCDQSGPMSIEDGGWEPVAPSALAFNGYPAPRELTTEEVGDIVQSFVAAARRAITAGFRVLELHGAHGYLIHEFLSPLSNHRQDQYGGSLENRARFLLEIVSGIREVIPVEVPLFIRFSGSDWIEGGWNEEQTATVSKWACDLGADFFDISSGGLQAGVHIPLTPGYQVPLAEYIRSNTPRDVSAVGLITTSKQVENILQAKQADAIMLGRQLLREPTFPLRAAAELKIDVDYCPGPYQAARKKKR